MNSDNTILPSRPKRPKMASSPNGLNADDTAAAAKQEIRNEYEMDNDDTTRSPKRPKVVPVPSAPDVTAAVGTTTMSTTTTTNLWELLDNSLLRNITSFLPNDELMKVSLVSQRTNESIPRATAAYKSRAPGTIVTVLQLSPSKEHNWLEERGWGRFNQLIHQLELRSRNSPNVLERYHHASMMDWYKFNINTLRDKLYPKGILEREFITHGPRIDGITSLDFCFSTPTTPEQYQADSGSGQIHTVRETDVFEKLSYLLPSLRELTFANMFIHPRAVALFFENCSRLEKLTYYNNNQIIESHQGSLYGFIFLDGTILRAGKNLRELYMDNTNFVINNYEFYCMADLENDDERVSKTFLFHECGSKVLERVSIRKAGVRVESYGDREILGPVDDMVIPIPQAALIKFIRNAPTTMRWFRSNLTQENIQMLQQERPKIEFVQ